jgi:hypothetical protein
VLAVAALVIALVVVAQAVDLVGITIFPLHPVALTQWLLVVMGLPLGAMVNKATSLMQV